MEPDPYGRFLRAARWAEVNARNTFDALVYRRAAVILYRIAAVAAVSSLGEDMPPIGDGGTFASVVVYLGNVGIDVMGEAVRQADECDTGRMVRH